VDDFDSVGSDFVRRSNDGASIRTATVVTVRAQTRPANKQGTIFTRRPDALSGLKSGVSILLADVL